jgi:hypothetical protein
VFQLKGELQDYFQENRRPDFAKLNKSLQGPEENFVTSSDKILGFKRKLNRWKNHAEKLVLAMFPLLLWLEGEEGYQQASSLIENHLEELQNKIKHFFPPFQHKCMRGRGTLTLNHLLSLRTL